MNKRGQTLIFFIILLPFIIGCMAFIIDTGIIAQEKNHLNKTIKMVIKNVYQNDKVDYETIENLLTKNKIDNNNLLIEINNNKIRIKKEKEIDSIFGSIIGIKKYKIKSEIVGYKNNNKIQFE